MKKEVFALIFALSLLFISFFFYKPQIIGYVTSSVTINSSAPVLLQNIPDQEWDEGTYNLNAFDLDDYFYDPYDPLVYNVTGNSIINVSINNNTNVVSFTQPSNFTGTEHVVFSASDRVNIAYSNNVTLSVVTPSPPPPEPPGPSGGAVGGGGGGGLSTPVEEVPLAVKVEILNFTVEPDLIKVSLKQTKTETRILKVINLGTEDLDIYVNTFNLDRFLIMSDNYFRLGVGETKILTLDFSAPEDEMPDLYFGKIILKDKNSTKIVNVIVEVNEIISLFDVDVKVQNEYKVINKGKPVVADIIIINLADVRDIDADMYYAIKDLNGNVVDSNQETLSVSNGLSFTRTLNTYDDMEYGDYMFYVRMTYLNNVSIGSDVFTVKNIFELPIKIARINIIIIIIIIIITTIIVAIVRYKSLKKKARILKLYFMINEAHRLVEEGNFKVASELYIKIKLAYHQSLSRDELKDETKIRDELNKLYNNLKKSGLSEKVIGKKEIKFKDVVKKEKQEKGEEGIKKI